MGTLNRRKFMGYTLSTVCSTTIAGLAVWPSGESLFEISLAQWSLWRSYFGRSLAARISDWEDLAAIVNDPTTILQGDIDPIDFPVFARRQFDIGAVEYVNTFYRGRLAEPGFLTELGRRADGEGVKNLLIMCDLEGALGDPVADRRRQAIENHVKWLEAAASLGCHSIRVNAKSEGTREEQAKLVADGLRGLAERAEAYSLNILVENHGGFSSDSSWLMEVMRMASHRSLGTLPDFGNFQISDTESYDRYQGVRELMPLARAVSAKAHDFNEAGEVVETDYRRMLKIVLDAGYQGYIGIEYEGDGLSEFDGIRATKRLLERLRRELSTLYQKTSPGPDA